MSITDIREFIKSFTKGRNKDLVVLGIIVFSSATGFGLGRMSALESEQVIIEQRASMASVFIAGENQNTATQDIVENSTEGSGQVVASKSGAKYHFPWCAGARSIKEENKITFVSIEEARDAGYTPAANCKGLK